MKEDTQKLVGHVLAADAPPVRDSVHVAVVSLVCGGERFGMGPGQAFKLASGTEDNEFPTALSADYDEGNAVGVVDPFLFKRGETQRRHGLEPGEKFLGFLFPGTVTGLTHRWEHPAFRPRDAAPPPLAVMDKEARRDAFLRAIAANPEDEGPHLEYADWLHEQGEEDQASRHKEWKVERQKSWDWLHAFAERWNFDFDHMMASAQMARYGMEDNYVTARGVDLHGAGELGVDLKTFWECVEVVTGHEYAPEERERLGWSCTC